MFMEKDLMDNGSFKVESSETRVDSGQNLKNADEEVGFSGNSVGFLDGFQSKHSTSGNSTIPDSGQNIQFSEKKLDFMRESRVDRCGFQSQAGDSGFQELTLSYMCEIPKPGGLVENNLEGKSLMSMKGKGVVSEHLREERKWIERDFLQLNDSEGGTSKRELEEENRREGDCGKKPKLETLKLSLALPDVSLSLTASNAAPNSDVAVQPKPSMNMQSLALSNFNTQTTCSNDFTAASLSYTHSHPFSHNPSCSLTRNSTEYYENSVGSRRRETDQIWNCGEGTNGSVHSRFKPIGDGICLSNHGGGVAYGLLNRARPFNRDSCNSLYRTAGSDSSSLFPSELPAKPRIDLCSVDSMNKSLDSKGLDILEDSRTQKHSRGERIVRDVIMQPISVMLQIFQEFPVKTIESAAGYVNSLIAAPGRKNELVDLQNLLERRSDLTKEMLSKSDKVQLEILVAIKFGLSEFVSGKVRLPISELVEIFLFMRCPNVNCKSLLPVDDCDCKICSTKKGFCSQCMCPVCYNYDCASNTCSWVGCDACSHWCHAACGTEKNLIRPGPSLKASSGKTEMQFYCLGCGHASEMFGFVKDVFICCAKDWGLETLVKELDCVRRIFKGSEDLKGKQLYLKVVELITRLERRVISPSDACNVITHFFTTDKDGTAEFQAPGTAVKGPTTSQGRPIIDAVPILASNLTPKSSTYNMHSASLLQDMLPYDHCHNTPKPYVVSERRLEDNSSEKFIKKDGFDSVESIVRIKEAEARMFQNRADEARKEVDAYKQLVEAKTEKLEEEYAQKFAKLCLQESEERRRKKLEELKIVENSHSDYYNMKIRMQAEISGLLERMEATKQLWV